jgi:SPW repeat
MRPWTRLQDWGTLLAGLYAGLSPIWISTTGERDGYWALIALGVLLAVTAAFSLAMPAVVATEWLTVLFGVLLFVAPWVLTYTDRVGASWTSWVVGAIAVGAGRLHRPVERQPAAPAGDPGTSRDDQGGAGLHGPAPFSCSVERSQRSAYLADG